MLQAADSAQNCLPSLHGALTLLCVWALCDKRHLLRSTLAVVLGVAICYAIIALRRHVSIDLAAGLAVGVAGGMLAKMQVFWTARRVISTETAS
jgi:membrane-associated phospholipid phosphatase